LQSLTFGTTNDLTKNPTSVECGKTSRPTEQPQVDRDLAVVIVNWLMLSPAVRAGIAAVVVAASERR